MTAVLENVRREIGHAGGHTPGATLVCVAALHGNEPSGVGALRRVFQRLEERRISIRGELVGLTGNLPALAAGRRFLERDLNRAWGTKDVETLLASPEDADDAESREQRELLKALDWATSRAVSDVVVLDLHTASSESAPFIILGDTLRNREFALSFPTPIVLGLEEQIGGTLTEYLTARGHTGLAVEAGRHEDPASVDHHEAIIWLALARLGMVAEADVPELTGYRRRLQDVSRGIPSLQEIYYRHGIGPDDGFVMRRGYRNFQALSPGEAFADDKHGPITVTRGARIFLPLYQGEGDDGYFLSRPVNRIWLTVSRIMRKLGLPSLARRLPDVRSHPQQKNTLVVGRFARRLLARELFHLLGYHVKTSEDGEWIAKRRRETR